MGTKRRPGKPPCDASTCSMMFALITISDFHCGSLAPVAVG